MRYLTLALSFLLTFSALSQPLDHAWLEGNKVRARINADGRLFCTDTSGAFWVPKNGDQPDDRVNVMRAAGLWLGGIDPGGSLRLSAQTYSPDSTDFVAGFRGVPNSGRVWKVTRADIEAHLADFYDNGVVDNPLPSIFGWPANQNRFFKYYNGFELPDTVLVQTPDFKLRTLHPSAKARFLTSRRHITFAPHQYAKSPCRNRSKRSSSMPARMRCSKMNCCAT